MIPYLTQTLLELYVAEAYLRTLEERRALIYQKYFGYKSPSNYDIVPSQHNGAKVDKSVLYLEELDEKKYNGRSLLEEMEFTRKDIECLKNGVKSMKLQLAKSSNIEDKLYYEIVAKGQKVGKAMQKVADDNYMTKKNIEKTYYPKIREDIQKLRNIRRKS